MLSESAMPGAEHHEFSVVVCTRNRERYLERALDSLLAQAYPKDRYELIVVDNGSSDGTRSLVEGYRDRGVPVPVTYLLERRPGTTFARNTGCDQARNAFIAYLDDDTTAAPGWLAAFDTAIREYGAVAGGGPVEPVLEEGVVPPSWWADPSIRAIFGLDHAHLCPEPVTRIRWPVWLGGGNCFYAKRILQEHGGFRTDIGPVGGRYRIAEDIELNARLERSGVPIHYVRAAAIEHTITADRLNARYIWMRSYAAGVTTAAAAEILGNRSPTGGPLQLARAGLRFLLTRRGGRTAAGSRFAYQLGSLRQRSVASLRSLSPPKTAVPG